MIYRKTYKEKTLQNAYENAVDCLWFGYGREFWNTCGISKAEVKK